MMKKRIQFSNFSFISEKYKSMLRITDERLGERLRILLVVADLLVVGSVTRVEKQFTETDKISF